MSVQTAVKTKREKGRPSLRWSLIVLILLCWVFPMMAVVGFSGYFTVQRSYAHVSDIVTFSVENATDIVRRDIDGIVDEALNASYTPDVRNAYSRYEEDGNMSGFYQSINTFLTQRYSRNQMIRAAYMLFPGVADSQYFYVYNPSLLSLPQQYQAFYTSGAAAQASGIFNTLGTDIAFVEAQGHLYVVRVLSLVSNKFSPYAILALEVNTDTLYESLQTMPYLTGATLYLNDTRLAVTGEPLAKTGEAEDTPLVQRASSRGQLSIMGEIQGKRFSLYYFTSANLYPLLNEMNTSLYVILAFAVLIVPLIAVVFVFFSRKVTRPIDQLVSLAGVIEEGEFGAQLEAETLGSAEFSLLGTRLNAMSARLENQFERIYREELALRDARIKALQSQINPHFLGNTLEIINWEARLAGNVKVSRMLESLSTMLEAALDRRHRPLIHLSEEMMYVNAYLYIIGERLGKRLTIQADIDEALLDWYVPRLILQPIVENAVEHGISARQTGRLTIRAFQSAPEWMTLEVENDSPLTPGDEANIQRLLSADAGAEEDPSGNIGIRNVHQRLRIIYGPKSGLTIKNTKNAHTVSSICIHHLQEPQDNAR